MHFLGLDVLRCTRGVCNNVEDYGPDKKHFAVNIVFCLDNGLIPANFTDGMLPTLHHGVNRKSNVLVCITL